MALIEFADKLLIAPGSSDPRIKARMGILHVDAGNAESLHDYFNGPSGGIESHGHIKLSGILEQYRDTDFQADANYLANDFALSFETQGFGDGIWTDNQIETIKRTMLWCKKNHSIPLRQVTSWNDSDGGWGYHTLFGAPGMWTPVAKSCPGPRRKEQFHDVLVPWMKTGGEPEAGPTPNITDALKAKDLEARMVALKKVIRRGGDEESAAAMQWLEAIRQIEKAKRLSAKARINLKDLEVR